jgi:Sulfotransferase domain
MKIFGIGLSRTGTTSLTVALSQLGLYAHHFPRTRALIDEVDAATDTPVAAWYQELDTAYPGSKFILTLRDVRDWLDSCEALWRTSSSFFDGFTSEIHRRLYGRDDFERVAFRAAYVRHLDDVLCHFAGRRRDLLLIDICAGEGWERICPFLGLDQPSIPFPRRNARAALGHDWVTDCPPGADGSTNNSLVIAQQAEPTHQNGSFERSDSVLFGGSDPLRRNSPSLG